jgi:hypothetical protein
MPPPLGGMTKMVSMLSTQEGLMETIAIWDAMPCKQVGHGNQHF